MKLILPNLIDLQLTNITGGVSKKNMNELLDAVRNLPNKTLMKLKLSGINLCDEGIVSAICEILHENNGNLSDIDFSWASLKPDHLYRMTQALNE